MKRFLKILLGFWIFVLLLPIESFAVGMNIGWSLYDYNTGKYEYYNMGSPGKRTFWQTSTWPNPGDGVPYGSDQTFWLWGYSALGSSAYALDITVDQELDEQYFISMFHWQPNLFVSPNNKSNIPATSPLSLDIETHYFEAIADNQAGHEQSVMFVLLRPEDGYSWTEDLTFRLSVADMPSGGGIGTSTRVSHQATIPVAPAPVPEPATLFLLGSGIIGLFGLKRKFKENERLRPLIE